MDGLQPHTCLAATIDGRVWVTRVCWSIFKDRSEEILPWKRNRTGLGLWLPSQAGAVIRVRGGGVGMTNGGGWRTVGFQIDKQHSGRSRGRTRIERSNFVTFINCNPTHRFARQINFYPFDLPIFEEASTFQS